MPSDHRSRAETHPAHNGKPEPRRVHKLLFPVPKLKDPIDPALLQHEKERADAAQNRVADKITAFSGSMLFVYIHIIWFGCWIGFGVEKYPFGLLTMIVSLEAIFLSTFVLISQNRLAAEADRRADLDLHIGLLTEHEVTRVLQMLDAVHEKLGIEAVGDSELAQLEMETRPEDVLAEIHRLQHALRPSRRHEPAAAE